MHYAGLTVIASCFPATRRRVVENYRCAQGVRACEAFWDSVEMAGPLSRSLFAASLKVPEKVDPLFAPVERQATVYTKQRLYTQSSGCN